MSPLGPSAAWCSPSTALRPCHGLAAGGPGRRVAFQGAAFLGASGLAAAGLSAMAAGPGRWPRVAAASSSASRAQGNGPQPGDFGHPSRRATDILLVANALMFGLQLLTKQGLTAWGIKANALIVAGQWWRLLSPAFLHGSVAHLAMNSYSLNNLGPAVESKTGTPRFLIVYLVAAVAGNVASFFGNPRALSLGASGAVFGVGGALAAHFYCNRDVYGKRGDRVLHQLWQNLLINVLFATYAPQIDNWGHMGGMVGGGLVALLLGPRWTAAKLQGKSGTWLVDRAPLPWLRSPPHQLR